MYALKRHAYVSQVVTNCQNRHSSRLLLRSYQLLKENISKSKADRFRTEKSAEFRSFNLKIKAWTVLMQYFKENETRFYSNSQLLSESEIKERTEGVCLYDIAERKRMSVLFNALRFGIKARSVSLRN